MNNKFKNFKFLFLDRDGVINYRPLNDYIKSWSEFMFLPGVLEGVQILSNLFNRIFIVTNQQGISKGLMSITDLEVIHQKMLSEIEKHGGRIDQIYVCTDHSTIPNNCRKPGIKMAEMAKHDFPDVNFNKSLMVGDTESDMAFGRNAGMKTVLIRSINEQVNDELVDYFFNNLIDFAKTVSAND